MAEVSTLQYRTASAEIVDVVALMVSQNLPKLHINM